MTEPKRDYGSGNIDMAEAFPSRFLSGADIVDKEGNPVDLTLRIEAVTVEDMVIRDKRGRGETSTVYVVYFVGSKVDAHGEKRGLKLNNTRAKILINMFGRMSADWVGKRIVLFAENVPAFGDVWNVASVRPYSPDAKKASAPAGQPTGRVKRSDGAIVDESTGEVNTDDDAIEWESIVGAPSHKPPTPPAAPLLEMALLPTTKQARSATNGSGLLHTGRGA